VLYLEDTARDQDLSGKGRYLDRSAIRRRNQTSWAGSSRTTGRGSSSSRQELVRWEFFSGPGRALANIHRADQVAAAVSGFFWPKIFWDFLTKTLDPAVKPAPILQTINLIFGLILIAWEWPLGFLAGSGIHRSLEARLAFLPLTALAAALIYQGTNAAIYQLIGLAVYFWAYSEGEVCAPALFCSRFARTFS